MKTPRESKLPLRERKKVKLRSALISTSFRLFREKGYAQTTLEEIAERCDVTVQTLLRYFGSKEDLLFANQAIIRERFEEGLQAAIREKTVLDYWNKFLHENAIKLLDNREVRESYSIIAAAPSLVSRLFSIAQMYRTLLEHALSAEAGYKAGEDLHSTLLAHLVAVGPMEPAMRALSRGNPKDALKLCDQVVQYARNNFRRPPAKSAKKAERYKRGRRTSSRLRVS